VGTIPVNVTRLQRDWERFGAADPVWAVLTDGKDTPDDRSPAEVFALGRADVARWLARLAELGGAATGERALDFGCGVGRLSQGLGHHYSSVVGVDVSRPMLAAAERHNAQPGRVTFVHNTRDDLSLFEDGSFDLVLTHIVLQHMPSELAMRYLGEFMRVLRPGGSLIFQIPTARVQRRWRYAVIKSLPWLVAGYRRARYGPTPHMEMNAVSPEVIAATITAGRGKVMAADPDFSAGSAFRSATYYVCKLPNK
jgi:SAM-dependent methyltransferase